MSVQEDVAVARAAAQAMGRAVQAVSRHYGDSPDVRRLQQDAGRLVEDLDLLCGAEAPPAPPPPVRPLEIIEDRDYDRSFWMDAEDEGLGQAGRPR